MKLTNKWYDRLKDIALCWMPYGITFIGVFITAWGIPFGEPILATLAGLNALLGSVVKYYAKKYNDESEV